MSKQINYKFLNSQEEYFYYWLEELYDNGFISRIEPDQSSFTLNNSLSIDYTKIKGKSKLTTAQLKLIKERSYTPDFIFEFTKKAENVFYFIENSNKQVFPFVNKDNKIYVDTKGEYTKHYSSSITFGDRQAMMWDRHSIYVQIIKAYIKEGKKCLFEETFTPKKVVKKEVYLKDIPIKNIKKGDTKIKFKIRTLDEYLESV
jgi:hypothetical protein